MRTAALLAVLSTLVALPGCRRNPPPDPSPPAPPSASDSASTSAPPSAGVPAPASSGAAPASSAEVSPKTLQVIEEGREPRALSAFTFVPGRREAAVLELDSHIELAGKPRVDEHVSLKLSVRYPTPDTVELTLRHAETNAHDVPGLDSTVGAVFKQRFDKHGATDPADATFPAGANEGAKSYVQGVVSQVGSNLLPALPPTPIGEGARWRWGGAEGPVYTLVSRGDGKLVVEETVAVHGQHQGSRKKMIEVNEDGTVHLETPLDGISRHVEENLTAERVGGSKRTTHLLFDIEKRR